MIFKLDSDYTLVLFKDHQWIDVELVPCFPITNKENYFSLKNKEGLEVGFIKDISELDEINRELISKYLKFKVYKCKITGFYSISEDFGLRNFHAHTNMGERLFQTALDEWPVLSETNEIFITDVYGENFVVGELEFGADLLAPYV